MPHDTKITKAQFEAIKSKMWANFKKRSKNGNRVDFAKNSIENDLPPYIAGYLECASRACNEACMDQKSWLEDLVRAISHFVKNDDGPVPTAFSIRQEVTS